MQALFVYIATPDKECAHMIAKALVSERLAAGANILDSMESLYWWEGEVCNAHECVCICKTSTERYPDLEKRVTELHPYKIPCIIALPITEGSAPFLHWVFSETRSYKE